MSKVTVVGAGNVGATCANVLAHKDVVNEIVLLDLIGDLAKGKALDSWQHSKNDNARYGSCTNGLLAPRVKKNHHTFVLKHDALW